MVSEVFLALCVDFVNGWQLHLFQTCVGNTLDGTQHTALTRSNEQNRFTGTSSTASTSDAVNIRLGVVRDIEVDHVRNAVNIETTCCNVGSNQDVQTAILELVNGALTLILRDIAVDGCGVIACIAKLFCNFFSLMLGATEYDHCVVVSYFQDASEGIELCAVRGQQEALLNIVIRASFSLDSDLCRIVQVLLRQATNTVWHGCREQCDLLFFRSVSEDSLNIFLEAHVQHLVCFVEYQETQLGNIQRTLFQVVNDTTWCTHDDLCATAKARKLNAVGLSAVNRQHIDASQMACK